MRSNDSPKKNWRAARALFSRDTAVRVVNAGIQWTEDVAETISNIPPAIFSRKTGAAFKVILCVSALNVCTATLGRSHGMTKEEVIKNASEDTFKFNEVFVLTPLIGLILLGSEICRNTRLRGLDKSLLKEWSFNKGADAVVSQPVAYRSIGVVSTAVLAGTLGLVSYYVDPRAAAELAVSFGGGFPLLDRLHRGGLPTDRPTSAKAACL